MSTASIHNQVFSFFINPAVLQGSSVEMITRSTLNVLKWNLLYDNFWRIYGKTIIDGADYFIVAGTLCDRYLCKVMKRV